MHIKDKIIVITGAASGIGRALAQRFAAEGAKLVVCADRDGEGAAATAKAVGGVAFTVDVAKEEDIQHLIETVEAEHGPIDLFCSNAGIGIGGGAEASNEGWQRIWDINVMAHVWAARHLVPRMVGARRRLSAQHRLGRRPAVADRLGPLCGDQARRRRPGRMAGDHPRRPGHQGLGALPAGGAHRDDRRQSRRRRQRRRHDGAGRRWPRPASGRSRPRTS